MEYKYTEDALSHYDFDIPESEVNLIRHNENMTFRAGTEYLLQIHKPAEGFQPQHIYKDIDRTELRRTEMKFLFHLKKQGMIIREPLENRDGELITMLDNGITATLSKWIEGESLDKLEITPDLCRQIGELTACLHKCAKGFQLSPVIAYDEHYCEYIKECFLCIDYHDLDPAYFEIMQKTCDSLGTAIRKLKDEFILIHADLSPSNILAVNNQLAAIDFSFFGMGHPMFDLANLFGNINGLTCRQKIAEGYRDAGGIINYRALDVCFAMCILGSIAIHFEKWSSQEWFKNSLKRWCRESFEPFCSGERLFADDFYLIHA